MRLLLLIIAVAGTVLFASLFAFTFGVPQTVENSAKGFVKAQIEREVREQYQTAVDSKLADKALKIAGQLGFEEQRLQQSLDEGLPEKIAEIVAAMCGYDCEKKKAVAKGITEGYLERLKQLQVAQVNLADIVKGKYLQIVGALKHDLRIFLGSTGTMFLLLLVIAVIKSGASQHLLLPGFLLLVSTLVAVSIYLFGQDWFYTILYNDYMGWGYTAYIAVIFGFLMDVVFNRGRITLEIVNGIANAIGSAFSLAPC